MRANTENQSDKVADQSQEDPMREAVRQLIAEEVKRPRETNTTGAGSPKTMVLSPENGVDSRLLTSMANAPPAAFSREHLRPDGRGLGPGGPAQNKVSIVELRGSQDGGDVDHRLAPKGIIAFRLERLRTGLKLKYLVWVSVVGLIVWRPWLWLGALVFLFWVGLLAYVILGVERFGMVSAWVRSRMVKMFPKQTAAIVQRTQASADKIEGWLARAPAKWTDGIYLPDFGRSQSEEDDQSEQLDPFDRLAVERRS